MTEYQDLLINEYAEQYATNWYKFDEGSGTWLKDSKSGIVGTINGATWFPVGGLKFDGGDYVSFPNRILPLDKFTIYMEFEIDKNNPDTFLLATTTGINVSGIKINITGHNLRFYVSNGVIANASKTIIELSMSKKYKLYFIWNNGIAKIVDADTREILSQDTLVFQRIPAHSYNMRIGTSPASPAFYFSGNIYNLYIINDDITTLSLNKTLILSNGEYKKFNMLTSPISLIPKLTSNSSNNFVISSSSVMSNNIEYQPCKAFDNDNSTFFHSEQNAPQWISCQSTVDKLNITSFKMRNRSDSYATEAPTAFILQGSVDGIIWTDIQTYTGVSWTVVGITQEFAVNNNNNKYYHYHRIYATALGGRGYMALSNIEFIGRKESNSTIGWKTVSTTLSNPTQFLEQGMDNLSPLLDRKVTTLEPMSMTDKSEILGVGEIGRVFSKTIDLKKYFDIRSMKVEVK